MHRLTAWFHNVAGEKDTTTNKAATQKQKRQQLTANNENCSGLRAVSGSWFSRQQQKNNDKATKPQKLLAVSPANLNANTKSTGGSTTPTGWQYHCPYRTLDRQQQQQQQQTQRQPSPAVMSRSAYHTSKFPVEPESRPAAVSLVDQNWASPLVNAPAGSKRRTEQQQKQRQQAIPAILLSSVDAEEQMNMRNSRDLNDLNLGPTSWSTISTSSLHRRTKIRTNPWFGSVNEKQINSSAPNRPRLNLNHTSDKNNNETQTLNAQVLDESMCSSGYGSHDSSPESSVHTPDWQADAHNPAQITASPRPVESRSEAGTTDIMYRSMTLDKAVACNAREMDIELGYCSGYTVSSDDSDCCSDSDYEFACSQADTLTCCSPKKQKPMKGAPRFVAPPPPPFPPSRKQTHSAAGDKDSQILTELSRRVSSLRANTRILERVVQDAKIERERRMKEREMCMEQIQQLTRCTWRMQRQFEMYL